jgi:hypothetical protein
MSEQPAVACHCTSCRKFTGGICARKEHVFIERGDTLKWYRSSAEAQRGLAR